MKLNRYLVFILHSPKTKDFILQRAFHEYVNILYVERSQEVQNYIYLPSILPKISHEYIALVVS